MRGGARWSDLTVIELQAYMVCALYMGSKGQLNYYTYWMRDSLWHCLGIFSRLRFQQLRRCLHLTNLHGIGRGDIGYDKIGQTRWLVDAI